MNFAPMGDDSVFYTILKLTLLKTGTQCWPFLLRPACAGHPTSLLTFFPCVNQLH